jgi:TolB-like protein/DNA-binding winged helix-turn-helix (wHTH) protein/Flp pilus assembly protein TadD
MSSLTSNLYQFEGFHLDPQNRVLRRDGAVVPLTPKAFDVLLVLIQNGGRIVTKDELMKAVWPDSFVEESNLTQTIFMVRKALDETADRRYVLTVQGQGYRFLVPVIEAVEQLEPSEIASPIPSPSLGSVPEIQPPSRRRGAWDRRGAVIAGAAVALVVIVACAFWIWRPWHRAVEQPGRTMLAVLPFENFTGDQGQEYFSDGLTEEMILQLGNLDPAHLGVIARTSVMHYKHTQESIPQIGKDLGVQYVIEGSVRRDSERVRITAQLIQVKDQSHLWAREYDRDLGHLLELHAEIARELANEVEFSLRGLRPIEAGRVAAAHPPSAQSYETYDLYLKGRFFWNKRTLDGFRQAAGYFQQAIDKDPNFGRAYAGLADTFSLMSTWHLGPQNELMPKARAAALRALQLDDRLAEAHASLALIKEDYDYDWVGAENEFQRAIQLDPQYPTAHQWYAESLAWQGRFPEAFAESDMARHLDPLSPIIANDHASILYYSRQYEAAIAAYHSILELDPTFEHARGGLVPCYLQQGRYEDAIEELRNWGHGPGSWAWQAVAYSRAGREKEALQAIAKVQQVSTSHPDRTAALLLAYTATGQKERLLELLRTAYTEHSNAVVQIKVDPMYDPVRSDPRFQDLLRRIGLAH